MAPDFRFHIVEALNGFFKANKPFTRLLVVFAIFLLTGVKSLEIRVWLGLCRSGFSDQLDSQ